VTDWLQLNLRGMRDAFSSFGRAAGARVMEFDAGGVSIVNEAVPERSVFNSVVYLDPAALATEYERLATAYAEAGCAWTVWVPERDIETAALLEAAGHSLDAQPRAMGMGLKEIDEPGLSQIDWSAEADPGEMGALNDAAYGYPAGTWIKGMGRDPEGLRTYLARVDGEPAATVSSRDHEGDCAIWNVATAPAARGRGLATALMRKAVVDAAERGCRTTTLQATELGAPVYRRCGYEDFGAIGMWESRPPELAADAHPAPAA
jgi:ribosomal protein S18 acetylase RimI-like enzyme